MFVSRLLGRSLCLSSRLSIFTGSSLSVSSRRLLSSQGDVSVVKENDSLRLRHRDWPTHCTLPFVWLRDHCRCPLCFNSTTLQRQILIQPSWLNIVPTDVTTDEGTLKIKWSDGHLSSFEADWIWQHCFEGTKNKTEKITKQLWDAPSLRTFGGIPAVRYEDVVMDEKAVSQLIAHLMTLGVCLITGTPPSVEQTRVVIEKVCTLQTTLWGSGISILDSASSERSDDLAYTGSPLAPHVDGNYLLDGPGIQVFHMLENTVEGGETLLVDAFEAASSCLNEDDYRRLSTTPIHFEYRDQSGKVYRSTSTILRHDPVTEQLLQIRHCPNDVAPLTSIPPGAIRSFYESYISLISALSRPTAAYKIQLSPGSVLFVDNWRVMHARNGFKVSSGRRVMAGAYLGRADFMCRAISLGVID